MTTMNIKKNKALVAQRNIEIWKDNKIYKTYDITSK